MSFVDTISVASKTCPVATQRTSIKANQSSQNEGDFPKRITGPRLINTAVNHYSNTSGQLTNQQATMIDIVATSGQAFDTPKNQIKLLVNNNNNNNDQSHAGVTSKDEKPEPQNLYSEQDLYLATLISEYHDSLNVRDCPNQSCHRLKLVSYRMSQALFEKITTLREELRRFRGGDSMSSDPLSGDDAKDDLRYLDHPGLINLIHERDQRIDELEELRIRDAALVEEKAAKIKEWVSQKLKLLENQNRHLRDKSKFQDETIKSLNHQLNSARFQSTQDSAIVSDSSSQATSAVEMIDINKSLKMRRPLLKQEVSLTRKSSETDKHSDHTRSRSESPIYDAVGIEQQQQIAALQKPPEEKPPPRPLHQSDIWELQLYDLADQNFSSIMKQQGETDKVDSNTFESIETNSEKDMSFSRKSSSSSRNDLISLVKPLFTTIDGDQVVETDDIGNDSFTRSFSIDKSSLDEKPSPKLHPQSPLVLDRLRRSAAGREDQCEKSLMPNLFDSPLRRRNGRDCMLRTQSVRRNPSPDKLFDFIATDLSKRGFLVKHGALKNRSRWFVLKNFHLYSYKTESDELAKTVPIFDLKLNSSCQVQLISQSNESNFAFRIAYPDKQSLTLMAETARLRDEWVRMLTMVINLGDIEAANFHKHNSSYDGIVSLTRHGHTKRCYSVLVDQILFFLKSMTDPIPTAYVPLKGSKVREITDSYDNEFDDPALTSALGVFQDCSLAIYPKYSMSLDPIYITLGNQKETDRWFHYLSVASGVDQSYGTQFERTLTRMMIAGSMNDRIDIIAHSLSTYLGGDACCIWREQSVMSYSSKPIDHPLTSLPNETLRLEAVELFKSILLFTQVPIEPAAIDYHVSLLQNCLGRFLKFAELRNELYAQLIKQCTFIVHRSSSPKISISSGSCRSSFGLKHSSFVSSTTSECQCVTDVELLNNLMDEKLHFDSESTDETRERDLFGAKMLPPSKSELIQVMQILSLSVSLNIPKGRMRWWLIDHLKKFANPETETGKYALFTLKAIDRTIKNGGRDNVPSRMEIISVLLRNPYDHSRPHSLPVSFADGTYLVLEADGSTTVDELMESLTKNVDLRYSLASDFYLFSDDPSGSKELHILESQRKVLDIVGWWEQTFRRHNSGRYEHTKAIKIICKKRLLLRTEPDETHQERLLIMHQLNQEIISQRIPLRDQLCLELAALMAQLKHGDLNNYKDAAVVKAMVDQVISAHTPNLQYEPAQLEAHMMASWRNLTGRNAQDCVRVYLNCLRRLKFDQ